MRRADRKRAYQAPLTEGAVSELGASRPESRPLHLTMKVGLLSTGMAVGAVAVMMDGWLVIPVTCAAVALIASSFTGIPSRIVAYVRARRGASYEAVFSVAVPLFLAALSGLSVWLSVDAAAVLGDWGWTPIVPPILYAIAGVANLAALVVNIRALRKG